MSDPGQDHFTVNANRSTVAVGTSALLAALLVFAYLAAGGSSYEPSKVADPCMAREWRSPDGIKEIAEQFTLSALDGAACELGVSRETLAQGLATDKSMKAFAEQYDISDQDLDDAVHAGLVRGVDDAEAAGAINSVVAFGLREFVKRIPVDEAIKLIMDARPLFEGAGGFSDVLPGLLDDANNLLPNLGGLENLLP